ncbi:MarR family winged helix-turn-helix transcriptional regulator [Camelimonas lactis]
MSIMSTDGVTDGVADGDEPKLNLQSYLPYRMAVLSEVVAQGLARQHLNRFHIAIPEWRVLATLGAFSPLTAKAIGQHSRMHKTKVSRAVTALEARSLLRSEVSPHDRREINLWLSEEGQELYRQIVPLAHAYQAEIVAGIDPQDLETMTRTMEIIFQRADA